MTGSLNKIEEMIPASPWVRLHMDRIPQSGRVLDLACGSGRHSRLLAAADYSVLAVDRNADALAGLIGVSGIDTAAYDLEGDHWPLAGMLFSGIVVTNYLWRPRFDDLLALLKPGGVLVYQTFMLGNETYGKPSNPAFLLQPGELSQRVKAAGLRELAFAEGYMASPKPAMVQSICAVRE
jgi:SAM-dependent methyltransferase